MLKQRREEDLILNSESEKKRNRAQKVSKWNGGFQYMNSLSGARKLETADLLGTTRWTCGGQARNDYMQITCMNLI